MPYTPENNPYIPGDPYSYDLKWVVDRIKNLLSSIDTINQNVSDINQTIIDEIKSIFNEMLADGSFNVELVTDYDADTEALTISMILH